MEGGVDVLGDLAGIGDQERVLDDRQRDPGDVGLLEAVGADQVGANLAGDEHRRHRVHHRVGDRPSPGWSRPGQRSRAPPRPVPRPSRSPRPRVRRPARGEPGCASGRRRRARRRSAGWRRRGSRRRTRRPRPSALHTMHPRPAWAAECRTTAPRPRPARRRYRRSRESALRRYPSGWCPRARSAIRGGRSERRDLRDLELARLPLGAGQDRALDDPILCRSIVASIERTSSSPRWCGSRPEVEELRVRRVVVVLLGLDPRVRDTCGSRRRADLGGAALRRAPRARRPRTAP